MFFTVSSKCLGEDQVTEVVVYRNEDRDLHSKPKFSILMLKDLVRYSTTIPDEVDGDPHRGLT